MAGALRRGAAATLAVMIPARARWTGRLRTAQAAGVLLGATAVRRLLPPRRLTLVLGQPGPARQGVDVPLRVVGRERDVAVAVGRAAHRLPVATTCLDRAIAARLLLRAGGARPAVVIGLAPDEEPAASTSGWGAHAWLVGDTGVVVGGAEAAAFTPVTVFR